MKLNDRNVFLFDGTGAVLSALTVGVVLPYFSDWIGMPVDILHTLGWLAASFAVYSLSCYWLIKRTKPLMLFGIIAANSLYCLINIVLLLTSPDLTQIGRIYFLTETLIIFGVVFVEVKVLQTLMTLRRSYR